MLSEASRIYNSDQGIDRETADSVLRLPDSDIFTLFSLTNSIRVKHRSNKIDLCSIVNAKSGACPEDCLFCAQSARNKSGAEVYPLMNKNEMLRAARSARENGARRFCIVTSGRRVSDRDLEVICETVAEIRQMGLLPCATLGLLNYKQLMQLKKSGLYRYHHNLETSEDFFPYICSTHSFADKIRTVKAAKDAGLSVCSGGIFGLGESWNDRIDMAFTLRELDVDSVPINFFSPSSGSDLDKRGTLNPLEALKIIALYRLVLPRKEIRVCGGRPLTLRDLNSLIFLAGADGLLIGNYLTTSGRNPEDDVQMIKDMGLEY